MFSKFNSEMESESNIPKKTSKQQSLSKSRTQKLSSVIKNLNEKGNSNTLKSPPIPPKSSLIFFFY